MLWAGYHKIGAPLGEWVNKSCPAFLQTSIRQIRGTGFSRQKHENVAMWLLPLRMVGLSSRGLL